MESTGDLAVSAGAVGRSHMERAMRLILVTLLLLAAAASLAGVPQIAVPGDAPPSVGRSASRDVYFFDDMESGENGWTHVDYTVTATAHFHIDNYLPFDGTDHYWCGTFDYDANGGYGNSWDDRLELPAVDVSGATYPVLTFAYRCHSEIGYDFTFVQARQGGAFVDMNDGYDGAHGWTDLGAYGLPLEDMDNPVEARFRFISDGVWSDEDGLYLSNGGAFHVDNIKVYDFYGGQIYFYDDASAGGLCTPSIPGAAGDLWHIIDRRCPASSDPHSWWCGSDADTTHIPGGLQNGLISPFVDISGATVCTVACMLHAEVPAVDNDYWAFYVRFGAEDDWIGLAAYWGDFEACSGWGTAFSDGFDITEHLPADSVQFRLMFFTTENGCGPGVAGGAGIMVDDFQVATTSFGPPCRVCCFDDSCAVVTEGQCQTLGGLWYESELQCEPGVCDPRTYVVRPDGSGDFAKIQTAIDFSLNGGTVLLGDGTFTGTGNRGLYFHGKDIHLRSESGDPTACIIDAGGTTHGIGCVAGEGDSCVVRGVTIRNARGAGIRVDGGSAAIFRDCIIDDCEPSACGGGFWINDSAPTFEGCVFTGNDATGDGAIGCVAAGATPTFQSCTFVGNHGGAAPGIAVDAAAPIFDACLFAFNDVPVADAGAFTCCDIYGNTGGDWVGAISGQYGTDGNFADDPIFCDPDGGDFTLRSDSPCACAPGCGLIGAGDVNCIVAAFSGSPLRGVVPLDVTFTDETSGSPTAWAWDFEDDGVIDDGAQHPVHSYAEPGIYSVALVTLEDGDVTGFAVRNAYVEVVDSTLVRLASTEIMTGDPTPVPVTYQGPGDIRELSMAIAYDSALLIYSGLETLVPGELFSVHSSNDTVYIAWTDETGGLDPIPASSTDEPLCNILFTYASSPGVAELSFDEALCGLVGAGGEPVDYVTWRDDGVCGTATVDVGGVVSGEVLYWSDGGCVPAAHLTLAGARVEAWADSTGAYAFERQPAGPYSLTLEKSDDAYSVNSLDALVITRDVLGIEPLTGVWPPVLADVTGDGPITAADAAACVDAALGVYASPLEWVFEPDSVYVAVLESDATLNFTAGLTGDVNGDWVAGLAQTGRDPVIVSIPDTVLPSTEPLVDIPIRIDGPASLGALSLQVAFDDSVLQYLSASTPQPGVVLASNLIAGELRLEWYDATGGTQPITIDQGCLATISFASLVEPDGMGFTELVFGELSMLGDVVGVHLPDVAFDDGLCSFYDGTGVEHDLPATTGIRQNYPNPFNPMTTVRFATESPGPVTLRVFDVSGRCVRSLAAGRRYDAGEHEIVWDGCDDTGHPVPSGVYFCHMDAGGGIHARKVVLLK